MCVVQIHIRPDLEAMLLRYDNNRQWLRVDWLINYAAAGLIDAICDGWPWGPAEDWLHAVIVLQPLGLRWYAIMATMADLKLPDL